MKTAAITLLATLAMPLSLWAEAMATVPVLKSGVNRGETLSAENLMEKQVPASQVFAGTLTDAAQIVGQQAVRPLAAGKPLNKLHLRAVPVVSRGQPVTLRYSAGAVELTVKGQALDDANMGQPVKVLNPTTRATLVGTVSAPGTVDVN